MKAPVKPTYSPEDEETVLAGLFSWPECYDDLAAVLTAADFHVPWHQQVWTILERACRASERPTRSLLTSNGVDQDHQQQLFRSDLDPMRHETRAAGVAVALLALRRRAANFGDKITTQARDLETDPHELVAWIRTEANGMEAPVGVRPPSPGFAEFMATADEPPAWVVPGLLAATERLLLTGGEGHGKSTLLRQFAFCVSVGVHPFTGQRIKPMPVTVIDVENTRAQVQAGYRGLRAAGRARGLPDPDDNLRIQCRTEGLDLGHRADATWFAETVAANKPALVITGPLYKLHAGNPNDEEPARAIATAIDRVRARHGVAVLVETHSPWGQDGGRRPGRPYGSSLWARWPEFGLSLRPDGDQGRNVMHLEEWRGPRAERDWPRILRRGGEWPWTVVE